MFTGSMGKISVFCSYAREDEAIRQTLETHLKELRDEKIIDDWYDSRIQPGSRWNAEIESALDRTRLMLFIVTPHLLASTYVAEVEIPRALERERLGQCRVVPIMAVETEWGQSPLAQFQALPAGGRWISGHSSPDAAYRSVATGVREVCKRIVDWENPYKRSQVGDWAHFEHTTTLETGEAITAEGTEELVRKTEHAATLQLEMVINGELQKQTMTIDLTRPLEDRMGDMLSQTGVDLPANVEIWMGPAQYGDDVLNIGGRRYETICAKREMTIAQRGQRFRGRSATWRSIDVPLFGLVKGEGELPGFRQDQLLLGFGHGDAAARKPRIGSGAGAGAGSPPAALVGPGRWHAQMNAYGVQTNLELLLHENGALQGQQNVMGIATQLEGQWGFNTGSNTLIFQIMTMMMGVPVSQDVVQMQITGSQGALLHAQDMMGRQFLLQRVS